MRQRLSLCAALIRLRIWRRSRRARRLLALAEAGEVLVGPVTWRTLEKLANPATRREAFVYGPHTSPSWHRKALGLERERQADEAVRRGVETLRAAVEAQRMLQKRKASFGAGVAGVVERPAVPYGEQQPRVDLSGLPADAAARILGEAAAGRLGRYLLRIRITRDGSLEAARLIRRLREEGMDWLWCRGVDAEIIAKPNREKTGWRESRRCRPGERELADEGAEFTEPAGKEVQERVQRRGRKAG